MRNKTTWLERYELALSEDLTIKEIMKLRNIGQPKAIEIRKKVLEYCLLNNIEVNCNKVPTELVLTITELDLNYYYDKMIKEFEINKILKERLSYVSS